MIFGGEAYYEAIYVVPPVACSVFFIFMFNIFAIPQMYFEEQKMMSVASMTAAALNIVLNYIFINLFGYLAAGYTTLACYIAYSVGHYFFVRRVCKKEIGGVQLYDKRVILPLSAFVIASSVLFNFLYSVPMFIRYGLVLIIFVVLIIKRKTVLNVLKTLKKKK